MPTIFTEPEAQTMSTGPDPYQVAAMHRGANWFYWIAGLSLVNSLIFVSGGHWNFIIGLSFTQFIDGIADAIVNDGGPSFVTTLGIIFDIAIVGFFMLVGYFANRSIKTAFLIGIAVYGIDALLWLLFGGYLEIAFHAYALFFITRGFLACRSVSNSIPKVA